MDSDHRYARLVADEAPNIVHEEVHFTFKEGLEVLPRVVTAMETADASMIRAGVPLSKHISARGFKVVLCGEGADESMAGYRLFEQYHVDDSVQFSHELQRRLFSIETSELQRVDRCTSAHGLEARVPFMDVSFVKTLMGIAAEQVRWYT
jgi:asparagine synthase (glutamine-hydrolysing)